MSADLSFRNKAVLVTGANSGLGYAAAVKYAALGASPLILAEVLKTNLDIVPVVFDLSSFAAVRESVDRLDERLPGQRLDVVLLCAGVALPDYRTSPDGYEVTTQVNVLSNTLLALLLLPKLRAAASASNETSESLPHLCFLNSLASHAVEPKMLPDAAGRGETLLGNLNDRANYDVTRHYYLAKLAAWFAIRGLIEHPDFDTRNVIINACCTGMCRTNLQRDFPFVQRIMAKVSLLPLSRSAEEGSRSLITATGLGPESNGMFWRDDAYLPALLTMY
ncbi:hypothetical protein PG988_003890 [Apiospora saccharicola]